MSTAPSRLLQDATIHQVSLICKDIAQSRKFYEEVLAVRFITEFDPAGSARQGTANAWRFLRTPLTIPWSWWNQDGCKIYPRLEPQIASWQYRARLAGIS